MKKIILRIKKKDDILFFLLIFFIAIGITLNLNISASDEIWNFQNAYKMYSGFKIYEDINVIVTPLFFWLTEVIFHLFGANIFIFRIIHCIEMAVLYLFTYKILKKLKISKMFSLFVTIIFLIQGFFLLIMTSANYNNMALMVVIIGIYLLIHSKFKRNWLIQAIISIIIFLIKQNIGIYYIIGYCIFIILSKNIKKNKKINEVLKFIGTIILAISIFIIALIIDNNFYNFANYAFGGIFEFANENFIADSSCIIFVVMLMITNIILDIFLMKSKYFTKEKLENIRILFAFSFSLVLIFYPIFNWTHALIAIYVTLINLAYIVFTILKDFEKMLVGKIKKINYVFIIILIVFSSYNIYNWITYIKSETYFYSWEDPFFGGIIGKEEYNKNEEIIKYIEKNNKKVIILSNRAALYMVPLKRNNGDFDLPFKGNLGIKGEEGLIEKIKNMSYIQFLICDENDGKIYQEVVEAKEYIKDTKKHVGKIEDFEIYE